MKNKSLHIRLRTLLALLAIGSLTHISAQQPLRMDTLQYFGRNAIDFVLMGDGYTAEAEQQAKFGQDARNYTDSLFAFVPFNHYRQFFNVYALHVVSEESGITHPGIIKGDTLWCRSVSQLDTIHRNTFFGTTLDCGGIHRLAYVMRPHRADSLLRIYCPTVKQAGIIVNSDEYGGSGGRICVATCERRSHRIFIHELAHSFAGLADEYFAGDNFLDECPNQTNESSPEKVRWSRWIGEDGVGVFPHKGSEKATHYFKPFQASEGSKYCMMELLARDFCPVCREAIVQSIHRAAGFVGSFAPQGEIVENEKERRPQVGMEHFPFPPRRPDAPSLLTHVKVPREEGDRTFTLRDILRPDPNTLQIVWTVDGKEVARDAEQVTVSRKLLKKKRRHTVEALVTDATPMVRDVPVTQRITWEISR